MIFVAGALLLGPTACTRKKRRPDPKRPVVPVHVTPLAETVRSKDIVASGITAPLRETMLATQVQGALIRSNLKLGRRVKKGELLARVSTVGLFGQARGARAQIKQIKTDLAKAKRDHKQLKRLYEAKVESRKTYEDSRFLLRRLEAQLTGARATLAQIGEQYTGGVVKAPFDGIISHKGAEVGDYLSPGKIIGRVVDLSKVLITASVAEHDVLWIKRDTKVSVSLVAVPGRRFPGRIHAISPTAERTTGAYAIEVTVDNADGLLKGGMTARVVFARPGERGLFLRVDSVLKRESARVVFVVRADRKRVDRRLVKVSPPRDGVVRVLQGLVAGELVVTSGASQLQHGGQVEVVSGLRGTKAAAAMSRPPQPRPRPGAGR